jgi:hypothetical protein
MHEMTILTIWFASHVAGGILTMLMPRIVPDAPQKVEERERLARLSTFEHLEGDSMSMAYGNKAA